MPCKCAGWMMGGVCGELTCGEDDGVLVFVARDDEDVINVFMIF